MIPRVPQRPPAPPFDFDPDHFFIPQLYMNKAIFIFRRDLRLSDNTGLINALSNHKTVIPIFIFTKKQLSNNKYKSDNCVKFMIECLEDLDSQLSKYKSRLFYFYAKDKESDIIKKLLGSDNTITSVYVNADYTNYSIKRDEHIKNLCESMKVLFVSCDDLLLHPMGSVLNGSNDYYKKFTPYYKTASRLSVPLPHKNKYTNYLGSRNKLPNEFTGNIHKFYSKSLLSPNVKIVGGSSNSARILNNIGKFSNYNKCRNNLTYETTRLSAYNKFGTSSIRTVYHTMVKELGRKNDLIKQLYWRDFFYTITYNKPTILSGYNFNPSFDSVKWLTNSTATSVEKSWFKAWQNGLTGFPIIDACMRQLNTEGYLHNRGRLIVASFLVKVIGWDWRAGEKYFAIKLVDYDPAQNNGGWQWCSGSGVDAQPYYRIFNPWSQAIKYDPECKYIKKYVKELKNVPNKRILAWDKEYGPEYVEPIFDYKVRKAKILKLYK